MGSMHIGVQSGKWNERLTKVAEFEFLTRGRGRGIHDATPLRKMSVGKYSPKWPWKFWNKQQLYFLVSAGKLIFNGKFLSSNSGLVVDENLQSLIDN